MKELEYYVLENFIYKSISSNAWFVTYKELKREINEIDIILENIIKDIYNKDSESKELFLKLGISIVANNDFADVGEKLKIIVKFLKLDLRFRNMPKSNKIHKLLLNIINYYETNPNFPINELDNDLMSSHVTKDAIPLIYTIFGNDFSLRFIDYIYNDKRYNKVMGLYESVVIAKFQHLNYNIWNSIIEGSDKIPDKDEIILLIKTESRRTRSSFLIQIVTQTFENNDLDTHTNDFILLQIQVSMYKRKIDYIKEIFKTLNLSTLSADNFFQLFSFLICLNLEEEILTLIEFDNFTADFSKDSKFKNMFLIIYNRFIQNIDYDVNSFKFSSMNHYNLYRKFIESELTINQNIIDKIIIFQENNLSIS